MTVTGTARGMVHVRWFHGETQALHTESFQRDSLVPTPAAPKPLSDEERRKTDYSVASTGFIGQATEWTKSLFSLSLAGVGLSVTSLTGASSIQLLFATKCLLVCAAISFALTAITSVRAFDLGKALLAGEIEASRDGGFVSSREKDDIRFMVLKWFQSSSFYVGLASICLSAVTQTFIK